MSGTDAATAAAPADAPADQATDDPAAASAAPVRPADAVIVAVPEEEARRLLAGRSPPWTLPCARSVRPRSSRSWCTNPRSTRIRAVARCTRSRALAVRSP